MSSKSSGLATASIGTQEGEWRPGALILMLREGKKPEKLASTLRGWFPLLGTIRGRMDARLAGQAQPPLAEQPQRTKEKPYYSFGVPWSPTEVAIEPPGWMIKRPTAHAHDITAGTLTESQRHMAEEFRRGMASALGVPPEAIREDVVQRWIISFTQALVKPEYWVEVAPTTYRIRELGWQLGEIARSAYFRR